MHCGGAALPTARLVIPPPPSMNHGLNAGVAAAVKTADDDSPPDKVEVLLGEGQTFEPEAPKALPKEGMTRATFLC